MKSLVILIFAFFFVSVKSFTPNPVAYSDYNTSVSLMSYLKSHPEYYSSNSLFFQFDWYITKYEIQIILKIMTDIYKDYGLNGVFLILDEKAGINDINAYVAKLCQKLEDYFGYKRDSMYIVVMKYYVGVYGSSWNYIFSITTGGKYARKFLPDYEAQNLINKFGPTLKSYNYKNVQSLLTAISDVMDSHANDP